MTVLGISHTLCGAGCLLLGALVFFNLKATPTHRVLGTAYVVSMLVVNVAALCIYHLTGHFNLFHIFAVLSLAMVLIGWAQVVYRPRPKRWFYRHYTYMGWSYAGLLAASANEAFVRVAALKTLVQREGNWVILATQVAVLGACALLLARNRATLMKQYSR